MGGAAIERQSIQIGRIPALIWGGEAEEVILAVHGNLSHKADAPIRLLAERAVPRGCQVLSFDLPQHGDRKDEETLCKVVPCVEELKAVMAYAKTRWGRIGLFGNSVGVYFSLLAYGAEPLERCLFLSPVVDMERVITNMMGWFHVTEERLEAEGEIETPIGQTLYWDYYRYVKAHPVRAWEAPTWILYGGRDDLCEEPVVRAFAQRHGCRLEVIDQGGHYFHTEEELAVYRAWLEASLPGAIEKL